MGINLGADCGGASTAIDSAVKEAATESEAGIDSLGT